VAAGQIIDEDSELALKHAIAARRLASRIAVVREAVGLAAYAAGDWTTAIAELRTYHRMTGRQTHLPELADCERALGRPERAIDLYRGADKEALDKAGAIELLIVAAGARGDLGQHDAAVAMLQVRELTSDDAAEWAPRLRYAYADALLAAGRRDEAREWFARAAAVDDDQLTDAAERLLELDGVTIEGDEDDEEEADAAETDLNTDPLVDRDEADGASADDEFEDDEDDEDDDRDGQPYDAFQDDVDRDVEDKDAVAEESGELAPDLRADGDADVADADEADDAAEDDDEPDDADEDEAVEDPTAEDTTAEDPTAEDEKGQDDAFVAEADQKRPQA
jgi:tetratricopeptide (TPR) repeat protein